MAILLLCENQEYQEYLYCKKQANVWVLVSLLLNWKTSCCVKISRSEAAVARVWICFPSEWKSCNLDFHHADHIESYIILLVPRFWADHRHLLSKGPPLRPLHIYLVKWFLLINMYFKRSFRFTVEAFSPQALFVCSQYGPAPSET